VIEVFCGLSCSIYPTDVALFFFVVPIPQPFQLFDRIFENLDYLAKHHAPLQVSARQV
jgi:hypothetical protein